MPVVKQTRIVPFLPEQMFDLVVDVANYPEFLPWCVASRVREKSDKHIVADLVIGFKMVRERFTSRVTLDRDNLAIDTALVEGPFKHMTNNWRFRLAEDGKSAEIDIHVDFAFRSALLQRLLEPFFEEAQKRLIGAFESVPTSSMAIPRRQQIPPTRRPTRLRPSDLGPHRGRHRN